jgi:acetyl esterase
MVEEARIAGGGAAQPAAEGGPMTRPSRAAIPGEELEPGIREFVRRVNADYAARLGQAPADLAHARTVAEDVRAPWRSGGPEMASTEERRVGKSQVRVRLYRPVEAAILPVLAYIHGGGWTTFSLDTHDRLMREYAARAGCAVVGIDYSLSPEARFPRALDEIGEVLEWLHGEGEAIGLDTARWAIGGDSAGANLSLAAMLRARDWRQPTARGMVLNYGAFDEEPRPSHARYGGDGYMLTPAEMEAFWRNYRGEDRSLDPLARPLHADLAGLPPAFLCVAECDILADENREMACRLAAAGVETTCRIYRGATHSFLEAVSISPLADRAIGEGAAFLRRVLAR